MAPATFGVNCRSTGNQYGPRQVSKMSSMLAPAAISPGTSVPSRGGGFFLYAAALGRAEERTAGRRRGLSTFFTSARSLYGLGRKIVRPVCRK